MIVNVTQNEFNQEDRHNIELIDIDMDHLSDTLLKYLSIVQNSGSDVSLTPLIDIARAIRLYQEHILTFYDGSEVKF